MVLLCCRKVFCFRQKMYFLEFVTVVLHILMIVQCFLEISPILTKNKQPRNAIPYNMPKPENS